MTQLTFAFETVNANPTNDSFVPTAPVSPSDESSQARETNVVVRGRIPRRHRRTGLKQLADVLVDVLDRYSDVND